MGKQRLEVVGSLPRHITMTDGAFVVGYRIGRIRGQHGDEVVPERAAGEYAAAVKLNFWLQREQWKSCRSTGRASWMRAVSRLI